MSKRSRLIISWPAYFMRHSGHGNGLFIKAGVRKGKTTICSAITKELLSETEFYIASNVRFKNEVYELFGERLKYIVSDLDYFTYYISIPDDKPMLLIWDDAQASEGFQSTDQFSAPAKSLQRFLINIGKMETSFIYVCHRSYIPRALSEGFEPLYIHILKRGSFYLSDENFETAKEIKQAVQHKKARFVQLPEWSKFKKFVLPILTRAPASFEFILDHKELQNILTRWDIGEDLKRGIREFLNGQTGDDAEARLLKDLEALSYENIYLAIMLKKGELVSTGAKVRELFNANIIDKARKRAKKLGLR